MLKKIPVKREYLLTIGGLVLLVICYQLAFKKTMEAWQLNSRLKTQLLHAADLTYQPGYLERKQRNLDKVVGRYKVDSVSFRTNLISSLSSIAEREGVKLVSVPQDEPSLHGAQFTLEKLGFEGDFLALLKACNKMQTAAGLGIIRSVSWKVPLRKDKEKQSVIMELLVESAK